MNTVQLIILGAALSLSTAVSFLTARVWPGVVMSLLGLVAYLVVATLQATGWKSEGLFMVSAFSVAVMLTLGVPVAIVSFLGARLGYRWRQGPPLKKYARHGGTDDS